MKVLCIEASPRKQQSASIQTAHAFLDSLRECHPAVVVERMDLWSMQLPEFDGDALTAKYAGLSGTPLTAQQREVWDEINRLADRIKAADLLVLAIPLWNWGIPYKLKHLIDVISQKDVLFRFDATGFRGMLEHRKAVVIYARGVDYGPESITPAHSYDLQRPYVELWLNFIGITDIATLTVEKTLFGPETDHSVRAAAKQQARTLAQSCAPRS